MNPPYPWPPKYSREEDPQAWIDYDRDMEIANLKHAREDEERRGKRNAILFGILCFGIILTGILIGALR